MTRAECNTQYESLGMGTLIHKYAILPAERFGAESPLWKIALDDQEHTHQAGSMTAVYSPPSIRNFLDSGDLLYATRLERLTALQFRQPSRSTDPNVLQCVALVREYLVSPNVRRVDPRRPSEITKATIYRSV
jgi:hypothetical protein